MASLRATQGGDVDGENAWTEEGHRESYCTFSSEVEAGKFAEGKYGKCIDTSRCVEYKELKTKLILNIIISVITLDIVTLLMQYYPLQTTIIGGLCTIFFGVRKLAKVVWRNTGKLKGHEGRIGELEEVSKINKGDK